MISGAASHRNAGLRSVFIVLLWCLAPAAIGGCERAQERQPRTQPLDTFVGRIERSDAYVAVLTDHEEIGGYVTDGAHLSIWLAKARIHKGSVTLASREGRLLGAASIEEDSARGSLRLGKRRLRFTAGRAGANGGLFEASEQLAASSDSVQAGWIALADGSTRGAYETFVDGVVTRHGAPRLEAIVQIPGFGPQIPRELDSVYLDYLPAAPGE